MRVTGQKRGGGGQENAFVSTTNSNSFQMGEGKFQVSIARARFYLGQRKRGASWGGRGKTLKMQKISTRDREKGKAHENRKRGPLLTAALDVILGRQGGFHRLLHVLAKKALKIATIRKNYLREKSLDQPNGPVSLTRMRGGRPLHRKKAGTKHQLKSHNNVV